MFDINTIKPHTRIQLHVVKSHAASNLNRDDLGRPKEVTFGGVTRLRVSSQSIKRSIRMGEVFSAFRGYAGDTYGAAAMIRTTQLEAILAKALEDRGVAADKALDGAKAVSAKLSGESRKEEKELAAVKAAEKAAEKAAAKLAKSGAAKGQDSANDAPAPAPAAPQAEGTQLLAISQTEIDTIADHLAAYADKSDKKWGDKAVKELEELRKARKNRFLRGDLSPEMQLFGRMVTSDLFSNIDAQVQVAHAFTVHEANTERDYWTGVDDHKEATGQAGSGMIDVRRFGAGVFYQYASIDVDGLKSNLKGSHVELSDDAVNNLARDIINAFVLGFVGQNPTGHQNSFASHAMPEFVVAEIGGVFPHSAAAAFESPVSAHGAGYSAGARERFIQWLDARQKNYGADAVGRIVSIGLGPTSVALNDMVNTIAQSVAPGAAA